MNTKLLSLKSLSLAALLCASAAAQADITVYTTRASFLAAVMDAGTDTFNDLSIDSFDPPLLRMAGIHGYSASSGPSSSLFTAGEAGADVWLSTNNAYDTITFADFSAGVRAVGGNFFGTDIDGAFLPNSNVVLSASDGSTTRTITIEHATTGSFRGFVSSNPLTSVRLNNGGGNYWATANDVTLAAVPEPSSYAMLLGGLLVMGWLMKSRGG